MSNANITVFWYVMPFSLVHKYLQNTQRRITNHNLDFKQTDIQLDEIKYV
jgi:hypothetical protein